MQKLFIVLCLTASGALKAQELEVAVHIGYSVGETESLKKVMLLNEGLFSASFPINSSFVVLAGVGGSAVHYASQVQGQNLFHKNVFLLLPLQFRKQWIVSARGSIYMEIGLLASFLIRNRVEQISGGGGGTRSLDAQGGSFSLAGSGGYRYQIDNLNAFSVGVGSSQEFARMRGSAPGHIDQAKRFLDLSFYRSLKVRTLLKTFKKI